MADEVQYIVTKPRSWLNCGSIEQAMGEGDIVGHFYYTGLAGYEGEKEGIRAVLYDPKPVLLRVVGQEQDNIGQVRDRVRKLQLKEYINLGSKTAAERSITTGAFECTLTYERTNVQNFIHRIKL